MSTTERGMGLGLRALNNLAGSSLLDRTHLREPAQRLLLRGTRAGFRTAAAASRTFERAAALAGPARQRPHHTAGLFDLTPDEDQQMLSGMIGKQGGQTRSHGTLLARKRIEQEDRKIGSFPCFTS